MNLSFGPYEIVSRLGAGGMGEVFRATDTRLGRTVALKVLPADRVADAEARARFEREARAIAALNHPNICAIHDVGLGTDDQPPFLVMELLEGQTLQDRLLKGPLDIEHVVEYGAALADALDLAHTRGLIHRDLKPANVFLTSRGVPKILDFGLAKTLVEQESDVTRRAADLTELGTTVGTVAYMSPEQLRAEPLDVRSDLFSFGLVLYEMATGQRAFGGGTSAVVSAAILTQDPAPPRTIRADLPERLEETILKALEKDRNVRCQTAAELRADLLRLKRQSGSQYTRVAAAPVGTSLSGASPGASAPTVSPIVPASTANASPVTSSTATAEMPHGTARNRTGVWIAGAAAAALVAAGGYALGIYGRGEGAVSNAGLATGGLGDRRGGPPPPPPDGRGRGPMDEARGGSTQVGTAVGATGVAAETAVARGTSVGPPPAPASGAAQPPASPVPPPPPAGVTAPPPQTASPAFAGARDGRRGLGSGRRGMPGVPGLVEMLKTLPPLPFDIAFAAGNPRAREMAMLLRGALTSAGWTSVAMNEVPDPQALLAVMVPQHSPSSAALVNWARRAGYDPDVRLTPRVLRLRIIIGAQK
jgi:serine/threonine protein kinase